MYWVRVGFEQFSMFACVKSLFDRGHNESARIPIGLWASPSFSYQQRAIF